MSPFTISITRRRVAMTVAAALAAVAPVAAGALPAAGDVSGADVLQATTPETTLPTVSTVVTTTTELPAPVASIVEGTGLVGGATSTTTAPPTTAPATTTTTVPASGGGGDDKAAGKGGPSLVAGGSGTGRITDDGDGERASGDAPILDEAAREAPAFDGMGMVHAVEGDPFAAWDTGYMPTWGSRSTASVLELLGAGATPDQIAKVLAPFPVAGPASYSDDWGAPRFTPAFHAHAGTDVFAARGTPVIASSDGTITRMATGTAIGGTTVQLSTADGTYFYYAHLDAHAPGLAVGQVVAQGSVLGYVGTSGNAEGTPPHLHYEIHPQGGAAVPPVPYLDRWLADAAARATGFAGAADPIAAEQFLTDAAAARTPVVPIVPAAGIGPLDVTPVSDLDDPSGALVLIAGATLALAWRRRRGMVTLAALAETGGLPLPTARGRMARLAPRGRGAPPAPSRLEARLGLVYGLQARR